MLILTLTTTVRADSEDQFTILQINDIYKIDGLEKGQVGGLGRVRTLREQLEADGKPVLLLHAGDFLFPSLTSKFLSTAPMIRAMNLLDGDPSAYDTRMAVTFGNHEFEEKDPGIFLGRIAQSDFPWLTTNILYRPIPDRPGERLSERVGKAHEVMMFDAGGVLVGVFGLTLDVQKSDFVDYRYDDPATRFQLAENAVNRLRAMGAHVVIALTHQEMTQDVRLARAVPGIDLIVGGHEHTYQTRTVGDTLITKGDADAKSVVVIDVTAPVDGPVTASQRRVPLGSDIAPDPALLSLAQETQQALARAIQKQTGRDPLTIIGTTEHTLEGIEEAVRTRESALGNFLADVVRDRMRTEIAFINGGGIRINDNIPAGSDINGFDIEGIFYYDNMLAACDLTGAQLLDILRNAVSQVDEGSGQFLHVSGIRFRYHHDASTDPPTIRVDPADVEILSCGAARYEPLDLSKTYRAGTTDFLWKNGYQDGFLLFSAGDDKGGTSPPRIGPEDISFHKATEQAISDLPCHRVTTAIEGRIQRVED